MMQRINGTASIAENVIAETFATLKVLGEGNFKWNVVSSQASFIHGFKVIL